MADMKKIEEIAKVVSEKSTHYMRLSWVQYTVGYDLGINKAYQEMVEIYKNKEYYDEIKCAYEGELSDIDKRKCEIMLNAFEDYHLSDELRELDEKIERKTTELSQVLNTHRAVLDGKEISSTEIYQILNSSEDRELRKRAFLAQGQVNKPLIEAGFLELINLRKQYAKAYGAKNFVEYSLKKQDLSSEIFENWAEELKEFLPTLKKMEKEYAEKYLGFSDLKPWDSAYLSSKIAPQMNKKVDLTGFLKPIQELFAKLGIDISKDNTTYDVFPRKNKSEWGYNFPIESGVDSRILANVKDKFYEFGVLLHETGHSMHSFRLNSEETILNMGVSGIISEGIANLFQGFLSEEIFFHDFFENELEETKENFALLKKWGRANKLRSIFRILFDQALYLTELNSIDDIHALYWKMNKELLDDEPYADEPVWANLIHHTTHPIYLHNYFMGDVTCDMLKAVFKEKNTIEKITEKPEEFGKFIYEEVIAPAGRYPYLELFKKISGKDFSLKFLEL